MPDDRLQTCPIEDAGEVEFRLGDPPRVMTFGGDLLTAADPVQFLRELRACRRRHLKASA